MRMRTTDFSKHLTAYLSQYLPGQRNLSRNTIQSYCDTFRLLLLYCRAAKKMNIEKLTLNQLDKPLIEGFLQWLREERHSSLSTVNQRLAVIRAFFDYVQMEEPQMLFECQKIKNIPFKKAPKPPVVYLTTDALQTVLSLPDSSTRGGRRDLTLLSLLYDSAARVQELADLRVKDIRLEAPACVSLFGKGQKTRTVPLMKQTVSLLEKYISDEKLDPRSESDTSLFRNRQNHALTRAGISYILCKYVGVARNSISDIPTHVTPHILRHTKAMHLLQAGVNLIYIRDFLGHADVKTTQVYATAEFEVKRKALEEASSKIQLPVHPSWEQDSNLMDWLTNLCSRH